MTDDLNNIARDLSSIADRAAFLFDFDGTLVELEPNPLKIDPSPDTVRDLLSLAQVCPVALVSGRPVSALDKFLGKLPIATVGCHGAEERMQPEMAVLCAAAPIPQACSESFRLVAERHGCFFEDKLYSISMHLPFSHADDDLFKELEDVGRAAGRHYTVRKAGRTYEVLQPGVDKGSGIARLMSKSGFKGRIPVYFGDDVGIDSSLERVNELGGKLFAVRNKHAEAQQTVLSLFETADISVLIKLLNGYLRKNTP